MVVFSVFLFAIAILFAVFAVLIYKGNANLINCYHPERVKDKAVYCKAIANALLVIAATLALSGIVALFGETDAIALTALGVLFIGLIIGLRMLFRAQKKYGGGLF